MQKLVFVILVLLAVTAVAIADIFLKKASVSGNLSLALRSPWLLGAIGLYLFQIFFFTYLFVSGMKLSVVGVLQTIFYEFIVLTAGVLYFKESVSSVQIVGIIFGIIGIILLNVG